MTIPDCIIKTVSEEIGVSFTHIEAAGAGLYNDTYFLNSAEKKNVIRLAPADDVPKLFYEIDMMRSEPEIHRRVREKTEIPVPAVVYADFTRREINRDYIVLEFMEGTPGMFNPRELGAYVRQLHYITNDRYGYPDRKAPTAESWPEIFGIYTEMIFQDCLDCGILSPEEKEWFMTYYRDYAGAIHDAEPCLIHLDLWTQNILTQDGTIRAIIDFDRGLYGDPELEFAVLDTYGYSTAAFFNGYGCPRPNDSDAVIRQRLYIVYELIKYAFIRYARGGSKAVGQSHVRECAKILQNI